MDVAAADTSRFDKFNIFTKTYKTVQGHNIELDILVPKSLSPLSFKDGQSAPVLLRFHGGGLSAGSSLFPPFFAPWLLQLAECYSAVIVSPNYRLIPESTVQDGLDDANDSLLWIRNSLQQETAAEIPFPIDVNRVLTTGDSAGAYLALQVALSYPDYVKSTVLAYPVVEADSPHFVGRYPKQTLGLPMVAPEVVSGHLSKLEAEGKTIVSGDPGAERLPLMFGLVQYGLLGPFFPLSQRGIFPLLRLDDGDRFPRGGVVVLHGEDDSVVPVEGSRKLEEKLKSVDPELRFRLVVRPGEHGFDHNIDLNDEWLVEALDTVIKSWVS